MTKYLIAATYSAQAMAGWIKEPGSDRLAAANGAAAKVGGKVTSITFVRGKYDFIAEFDLPNFEAAAALKMITMSSGAFSGNGYNGTSRPSMLLQTRLQKQQQVTRQSVSK
jgi:uncharacterized protein with GYD domain